MKNTRWTVLLFAMLAIGLMTGCGGSSEESGAADKLKSAAETAKEAGKDAAETAKETGEDAVDAASEAVEDGKEAMEGAAKGAEDLQKQIADKESELQKIADELKGLSPTELMGSKGKDLKSRQEKLMEQLAALQDKLKALGG